MQIGVLYVCFIYSSSEYYLLEFDFLYFILPRFFLNQTKDQIEDVIMNLNWKLCLDAFIFTLFIL